MVKHIVLFKLKNDAHRKELVEKILAMREKIEELVSLEAGEDFVGDARSFDVALVATFKNRQDLQTYIDHPVHILVKQFVNSVAEKTHSVDFFI